MPITITFPKHEINRFNREFEQEQQNISRLQFARSICGIWAEKSEAGQKEDGKKFMNLIKEGIR